MSDSYNPMDCSPPGSPVHGISYARIVEWVAVSFSRGSSQHRDQIWVSCIAGRFFTDSHWRSPLNIEPSGKSPPNINSSTIIHSWTEGKEHVCGCKTRFLILSTIDILEWIISSCWGLSCAFSDFSSISDLYPSSIGTSSIYVSTHINTHAHIYIYAHKDN